MEQMRKSNLVIKVALSLVRSEPSPGGVSCIDNYSLHGHVGQCPGGQQVSLDQEARVIAMVADGCHEAFAAQGLDAEAVVVYLGVQEKSVAVVHAASDALNPGADSK